MTEKIKVALVDDEILFRKGLELIINQDPEIEVVFHADNGQKFLDAIQQNIISEDTVILMDLSMPVKDGIDTLLEINQLEKKYKIIILTSHYTDAVITKLIDEGAASFLSKTENPDIVVETIKNVAQKGFYFDDYIMKLFRNKMLYGRKKNKKLAVDLSEREIEVLRLICQEYTAKEIAEQLYISPRTVEGHKNNLLEKTAAKNVVGLVLYAIEHRLFDVSIPLF